MLTSIKIENFKAFADSGDLPIRPLTFLMGPNSSGKSSLLHALLVIKQTLASRDSGRQLISEGDLVGVGSYPDFVYSHDPKRNVRFSMSFGLNRASKGRIATTAQPFLRQHDLPRLDVSDISLLVEFQRQSRSQRVFPNISTINTSPDEIILERKLTGRGGYRSSVDVPAFKIAYEAETELPSRFHEATPAYIARLSADWARDFLSEFPSQSPLHLERLQVERLRREAPQWTRVLIRRISTEIQQQFEDMIYLGPLRESPDRLYLATGESPDDVGLMGEMTFAAIWSSQSGHRLPTALLQKVNHWMAALNIAARVRLVRLPKSDYYSLTIVDPVTEHQINLIDTGFGASQVLPIIVQGFYGRNLRTLLIEQPEIHLHPRGQAVLADAFIDMVKSGRSLIVETHSEHMIGRIQRRIADGTINHSDVAILYFNRTREGTQVKQLNLNEYGQFEEEGIPEGFFEERYLETFELMKAISTRKRDEG